MRRAIHGGHGDRGNRRSAASAYHGAETTALARTSGTRPLLIGATMGNRLAGRGQHTGTAWSPVATSLCRVHVAEKVRGNGRSGAVPDGEPCWLERALSGHILSTRRWRGTTAAANGRARIRG
jgi:hypothetical protein